MSTRSTTHFVDSTGTIAIIYRHSDGYPEGAGRDLLSFLKECKALPDPRLYDAPYLAAKYVVFLANMFNNSLERNASGEYVSVPHKSRLDFLSVGIMSEDPSDIEYRYVVNCGKLTKGIPEVKCFEVTEVNSKVEPIKEVAIPRGKNKWA